MRENSHHPFEIHSGMSSNQILATNQLQEFEVLSPNLGKEL